ncbi:MAG: hypothetical protein OEV28_14360, partial [Nitrospirota bacterium]|nr:hypothetical protein [Nitrospirota bacterium]
MSDKKRSGLLYSIRTKFLAIIVVFVALLMFGVMGLINRTVGDVVLDQGLEKAIAVARGVASSSADPLLTDDDLGLFTIIQGAAKTKGILYCTIVGNDDKVKAHSIIERSGKAYIKIPEEKNFRVEQEYKIKYYDDPKFGNAYDIEIPVTSARIRDAIGYVHIGISQSVIDEAVDRVNRYIR